MKILVVNPNSSEIVTEVIIRSAKRKIVNPNTEIIPLTNYRGTKNIDCAFGDYQSTWSLIRAILKKVEEIKPDAVVLAGFGNVGIFALKEALDIPVLSISETSQTVACLMGHKYTVLTAMRQNIPLQEDLVRLYRLENKCASVRAIDVNVEKCVTEKEKTLNGLKEEILKILILLCARLKKLENLLKNLPKAKRLSHCLSWCWRLNPSPIIGLQIFIN